MSEKCNLTLTLQFPDKRFQKLLSKKMLKRVVQAALLSPTLGAEITLRFVTAEEGRALNRNYRGKDYATNVLTFSYSEDSAKSATRADIVLCTDVLLQEAVEQNKSVVDHTIHLIVHGMLHAQGYDHMQEEDAIEMESLETEILAVLHVKNPHEVHVR
ncbi:MAG: ybeY [Solimicrobium sp.]|jgi:probable rRNA maturation factor|nr:ybeY [Solimicrobium sp.]